MKLIILSLCVLGSLSAPVADDSTKESGAGAKSLSSAVPLAAVSPVVTAYHAAVPISADGKAIKAAAVQAVTSYAAGSHIKAAQEAFNVAQEAVKISQNVDGNPSVAFAATPSVSTYHAGAVGVGHQHAAAVNVGHHHAAVVQGTAQVSHAVVSPAVTSYHVSAPVVTSHVAAVAAVAPQTVTTHHHAVVSPAVTTYHAAAPVVSHAVAQQAVQFAPAAAVVAAPAAAITSYQAAAPAVVHALAAPTIRVTPGAVEKRIHYGVENVIAGTKVDIIKPKLDVPAIQAPQVFKARTEYAAPEVTVKQSEVTVHHKTAQHVPAPYDAGVVVQKAAPEFRNLHVPVPVDVPTPVHVSKPYTVPVPHHVKVKTAVKPVVSVDVHSVRTENVVTPLQYADHHHVHHHHAAAAVAPVAVAAPAAVTAYQAGHVGGVVGLAHGAVAHGAVAHGAVAHGAVAHGAVAHGAVAHGVTSYHAAGGHAVGHSVGHAFGHSVGHVVGNTSQNLIAPAGHIQFKAGGTQHVGVDGLNFQSYQAPAVAPVATVDFSSH